MKKKNHVILFIVMFAVTMLLLFASIIQKEFKIFKFRKILGVTVETTKPKFNLEDFNNFEYQKNLNKYLEDNFGFREPLILLYNQYAWSLFNKKFSHNVTVGKDNFLFEPWVIEEYNQTASYYKLNTYEQLYSKCDSVIELIYQFQNLYTNLGKTFVICLVPDKAVMYPEYLPDKNRFKPNTLGIPEYYSINLKKKGVNVLDFKDWFFSIKDTTDILVYPQTGTHWSMITSAYSFDSIIKYAESLSNKKIADYSFSKPYKKEANGIDVDLESILNLLKPIKKPLQYYVDIKVSNIDKDKKPNLIFLGDSYIWNIYAQMHLTEVFNKYPYWYYYNTIYYDPNHNNVNELNLYDELINSDYLFVIYSYTMTPKIADEFFEKAIKVLSENNDTIRKNSF
ncbi:MAG: alginate O-acetyltransferase AlgX-related protein [Bacteroidales bacterium]